MYESTPIQYDLNVLPTEPENFLKDPYIPNPNILLTREYNPFENRETDKSIAAIQRREDFKMRKLNLLRKTRQELRSLSISPKLVQEQVFSKFHDKLKGYEMKDISLSTKSRSVHSVAAMI